MKLELIEITSLPFISANPGAEEVLGMAANIYMMPFYDGSKACSVPEYLKLRLS